MFNATTVLADSWHHGHAWWPILWLFWLILIGGLVVLFARRGWRGPGRGSAATAILAERYARGEINADEYKERLSNLKEGGSRRSSGTGL
jgi:putative membrane protein